MEAISPNESYYDYALILGATYLSMKKRMEYFNHLKDKGIRFGKVYVLTGERDLDPNADHLPKSAPQSLKTEADMAVWMVQQQLTSAIGNERARDVVIRAPEKHRQGIKIRPSTKDTVRMWVLKTHSRPGSILVISNQPFIGTQTAIVSSELPNTFKIEGVGEKAHATTPEAVYLDTLARWIYQDEKNRHA